MEPSNQASRISRSDGNLTPGIGILVETWAAAWNAHDMQSAAALVAADVDFVTVAGRWLKGRDEFLRHHRDIHRRQMRDTTWATLGYEVRRLHEDFALAHLEWAISGERDADGAPRAARSGIFTWVVASTRDARLITAAHNTNLRADTSHRLACRGPQ
jgi:uncharacterized protein (TIGR02246 family)